MRPQGFRWWKFLVTANSIKLPVGVSQEGRTLIDNSSVETEEAFLGK